MVVDDQEANLMLLEQLLEAMAATATSPRTMKPDAKSCPLHQVA